MSDIKHRRPSFRIATALTVIMFSVWGLAHRLSDVVFPQFAKALALDAATATFALWSGSIGYFIASLPAVLLIRTFGYKTGVVSGLACYGFSTFLYFPAAQHNGYAFLIASMLVAACGLCILEVSVNPLVVSLGPRATAERRLNLAQTLYPIGAIAGFLIGHHILSSLREHPAADLAAALGGPYTYIGFASLLFAFVVDKVAFPAAASERVPRGAHIADSIARLFHNRQFLHGLGAQAMCSIAHLMLWGYTVRYAETVLGPSAGLTPASIFFGALVSFTAGRVVGTALMFKLSSSKLLTAFAAGAATTCAGAVLFQNDIGIACIMGANFFLSIIFPTVFAKAVKNLDEDRKAASGVLMFAAGTCGASVLAVTGLVTGPGIDARVMIVPCLAFSLIALYGISASAAGKAQT